MTYRGRVGAATCAVAAVVALPLAASADTVGRWAVTDGWDDATKTATLTVPATTGFPTVALASTSAGSAGPESGATRWLAPFTPPGAVFGSSQDQRYLNLRPAANNATSPSTSTYTFDRPTPTSGWAFTLGDIDAEYLDVSAIGTDGAPVALADLGFASAFNYCQGSPRPSGCDAAKAQPAPLWDAVIGRLAGPETDPDGAPIPGWSDTDGAAAWFRPTVALRSLTVTATWRVGSPTYQTWFAGLSRDASGTVAGVEGCSAEGLAVVLRDAAGAEVATTSTAADGTWSFDDLATYDDWTVDVAAPTDCTIDGGSARTVDLSSTDAVVDTTLVADVVAPPAEPDPEDPPTEPGDGVSVEPGDDVLPDTGAPSPWPAWLGAALLLAGSSLLAGSVRTVRPRSRRRHAR